MNAPTNSFKKPDIKFDLKNFAMCMDEFVKGNLKIGRSSYYRKGVIIRWPKRGYIFYRIFFKQGENIIYNGAYEINLEAEDELKRKDKLIQFLIFELTRVLTEEHKTE